ncbi:MAG: hypothetical protein R3F54_08715 [Alphaproteobacteria bacterium]
MDYFDDLDGYEKGVVARMLLGRLIKQGRLQRSLESREGREIAIPVSMWQLQMLARFSEDVDGPPVTSMDDRALASEPQRQRKCPGQAGAEVGQGGGMQSDEKSTLPIVLRACDLTVLRSDRSSP